MRPYLRLFAVPLKYSCSFLVDFLLISFSFLILLCGLMRNFFLFSFLVSNTTFTILDEDDKNTEYFLPNGMQYYCEIATFVSVIVFKVFPSTF